MRTNSYFIAFILVFLAGLSWSFGAVVVRHMENANNYVFQYLFCRGISIAIILIIYLFIKEGLNFYKNFLKIGLSGVMGGVFLATAFIGFIYSITITSEPSLFQTLDSSKPIYPPPMTTNFLGTL